MLQSVKSFHSNKNVFNLINVEKAGEFVFLGSVVPGSSSDMERRIELTFGQSAFGRLKEKIWSRKDISISLKIRLYYTLIVPIAVLLVKHGPLL